MIDIVLKRFLPILFVIAIIISFVPNSNIADATGLTNLAENQSRSGFPSASASYTCNCDNVWNAVDGIYSYDRWTSYPSFTETVSFTINFGSVIAFNQVKLYIYNDTGGVKTPASYKIQYWDGFNWIDTYNQVKAPETPYAEKYSNTTLPDNILNTVLFDTVSASELRVVFTNQSGASSGLVEIEVFLQPTLDESAALEVETLIDQLPLQADVLLSDRTEINAARNAYDTLTPSQKNLVSNLSVLTDVEVIIGILEEAQAANELIASAVETLINQLPLPAEVVLSDRTLIEETRNSYDSLTEFQQNYVNNLDVLIIAEAALANLEATLTDVAIRIVSSNEAGDVIKLKVIPALDLTYSLHTEDYQINVNGEQFVAAEVDYDLADTTGQTIKLTFSSPVLLNEASGALSLQSGAFRTYNNELNRAMNAVPIITFSFLDLSNDNQIGIDDIVLMIGNPELQIDVNTDGYYNSEDVRSLLGLIGRISFNIKANNP